MLAAMLAIGLHQLEPVALVEHLGGAHIDGDAVVVRKALDLAEQEDRRGGLAQTELIERAHLEMRIGALDDLELADLLRDLEALAQVAERREAHGGVYRFADHQRSSL